MTRELNRVSVATLLLTTLLGGCGGGPSTRPPTPDFGLSVTPVSASAVVGHDTTPMAVSVVPKAGFSGTVAVNITGVPQGVSVSPSSSFSVAVDANQALSFSVSATATAGIYPITIAGSAGSQAHSTQVMLTIEPIVIVTTYQSGSLLYLESDGGDKTRIGLQTEWGGSIVEVSLNGTNYVNEHDTGREVQFAQYDGNASYGGCASSGVGCGWNPVQGGDLYDEGSPVLAQTVGPDSLYIKAQGYQWFPNDKGGGPGNPVLGDTYVEATVTAVTNHASTFKVHSKVTHFGTDAHANALQEFPAVYVNLEYPQFTRYAGTAPWTNDAVTTITMPYLPSSTNTLYAPEQWAAFVDQNGNGLTVYIPGVFPYVGGFAAAGDTGPTGFGTNYFAPFAIYTFGPGAVLEGDVYLIAGDYKHARQVIYDLHNQLSVADIFTPFGTVDSPQANATVSGTTSVAGWAFDNVAVAEVDIYVDGVRAGMASYGISRPGVVKDFPSAPDGCGFSFSLDTRGYSNGTHTMQVKVVDTSGNTAVLPDILVTVAN